MAENGIDFKYPSYIQDILGPLCFDFGFGLFVGFVLVEIPMTLKKQMKLPAWC
jgi:hypothetical protein